MPKFRNNVCLQSCTAALDKQHSNAKKCVARAMEGIAMQALYALAEQL